MRDSRLEQMSINTYMYSCDNGKELLTIQEVHILKLNKL